MQTTQLFNNHSVLQYTVYTEWYIQYNVLYTVYLYGIQYTVCVTLMVWTQSACKECLVTHFYPGPDTMWFFYVLCCCLRTLHRSVINAVFLSIVYIGVCEENNFAPVVSALAFVRTRRYHRTPRVLLLGPPGSGKSNQAALLSQKYKMVDGTDTHKHTRDDRTMQQQHPPQFLCRSVCQCVVASC